MMKNKNTLRFINYYFIVKRSFITYINLFYKQNQFS